MKTCQEDEDIYEEIEEFPKKQNSGKDNRGMYKFEASDNCLVDEEEDDEEEGGLLAGNRREKIYEQIPREILRDLRRPQHFRRLGSDDDEATSSNSKSIMLKDLVRTFGIGVFWGLALLTGSFVLGFVGAINEICNNIMFSSVLSSILEISASN